MFGYHKNMFAENLSYKLDIQMTFRYKITNIKSSMDADDERKSRLICDEDYE